MNLINKYLYISFFVLPLFSSVACSASDPLKIDSTWFYRKQILPQYKNVTYLAIIQYEELKNVRIKFIEKKINTTAACLPVWYTLLNRRKNRVYKVYINTNEKKYGGAIMTHVPDSGKIGILGHELGHVVDYSKKSTFGIIVLGIKYLCIHQRSDIEKQVDRITIAHRLGYPLYKFSYYITNDITIPAWYKEYKKKVYYSPEELLELIKQQP
jgi:hypothetical protein